VLHAPRELPRIASITFITNRISLNVLEHVEVSISMLEHAIQTNLLFWNAIDCSKIALTPTVRLRPRHDSRTCAKALRLPGGTDRLRIHAAGPATQFAAADSRTAQLLALAIDCPSITKLRVLSLNGGRDTNTNAKGAYNRKTRVCRFGLLVALHF
jgi:hypothetical protein